MLNVERQDNSRHIESILADFEVYVYTGRSLLGWLDLVMQMAKYGERWSGVLLKGAV